MVTNKQVLKSLKVLLEYYKECSRLAVMDPFYDMMVVALTNEIARVLITALPHTPTHTSDDR